jgi:acyl transferase domain-containing protein
MDARGDHGEPVAIIGVACRFPEARDPAEFHDLAVAGRGMFQPATAEEGGPPGAVRCAGAVSGAEAGSPARSVT